MRPPERASSNNVDLQSLQGVWRRDWIEIDGHCDSGTRVLWAQAGDLFVDLRIPDRRPSIAGLGCLADLPREQLQQFRQAQGFAGHIALRDSICTWHREINWHGPPRDIDAGALHFDADGALIETGVHARYRERWQHTAPSCNSAQRVRAGQLQGIAIFCDAQFFLGIGAPITQQTTQPQYSDTQQFASEYVFGQWDGARGIAQLSTNPFSEQRQVLSRSDRAWIWHRHDWQGDATAIALQPQ